MPAAYVPDLYPSEPLPVRLINTRWGDRDGFHDSLETVAHLEQWTRQCGLDTPDHLSRDDLHQARALRDAVRRLAAVALDDDRPGVAFDLSPDDALGVLNGFLRPIAPQLRHDPDGGFQHSWSSPDTGFKRVLVDLALESTELLEAGPGRLGICHGPNCVLYFERVPARRGWCSEACGNRARVARHYQRHKNAGR